MLRRSFVICVPLASAAWLAAAADVPPATSKFSAAEIVETSGLKDETFPVWSMVKVQFPARGDQGPVTLHWYDGGKNLPDDKKQKIKEMLHGEPLHGRRTSM